MVYSSYVKQRILFLKCKGKTYRQIIDILNDEGHSVTKSDISGFLKRHEECGSILRKPGTGKASKKNEAILKFVDSQMERDDEASLEDPRWDACRR